jgi:glycerol-3-phosphate O-acyltransferase
MLIPCSVTYERLVEGSFARQLCGEKKLKESMANVVWNMFTALLRSPGYGYASIDFAKPISLKVVL